MSVLNILTNVYVEWNSFNMKANVLICCKMKYMWDVCTHTHNNFLAVCIRFVRKGIATNHPTFDIGCLCARCLKHTHKWKASVSCHTLRHNADVCIADVWHFILNAMRLSQTRGGSLATLRSKRSAYAELMRWQCYHEGFGLFLSSATIAVRLRLQRRQCRHGRRSDKTLQGIGTQNSRPSNVWIDTAKQLLNWYQRLRCGWAMWAKTINWCGQTQTCMDGGWNRTKRHWTFAFMCNEFHCTFTLLSMFNTDISHVKFKCHFTLL